jgi:hypothetical protein
MRASAFGDRSVAREIYDGTAEVGRASAFGYAVLGTILGGGGVALGVYVARRAKKEATVMGKTTKESSCSDVLVQSQQGNRLMTRTKRECYTPVAYEVEGAHFDTQAATSERRYGAGEDIGMFYQPGDPGGATASQTPWWLGYVIIAFAILIGVGGWTNLYFVRKSRVYAAANGLGAMKNVIL